MSRELLELALWQLTTDRSAKARFGENEREWLRRTGLDDDEAGTVERRDVAALSAAGVNPMLVMGFWMEQVGPDKTAYVDALKSAGAGGA